ncbi:MAG: hypothetical protein ABI593_08075 [Betaproteobacteria bacterium]
MNRSSLTIAALAAVLVLAACGDKTPQAPASTSSLPATPPAPPAVAAPTLPTPPLPTTSGVDPAVTAKDSATTDPKGTLTKEEESKSMPEALQGNNHSSPALDPPAKK